jgi:DNA-binding NarL/FixJ family response regulator
LATAKLLLVDDDETVLLGLGGVLEAHEFEVTTASSVVEALRHITSKSFDVLLSDLHMPSPGDGLIVVGAMRRAHPTAVTLILSANPDMTKASAAMLGHADEIFLKPVKPVPIIELIRQRLAGQDSAPGPSRVVESVATVLERELASITRAWLARMAESGSLTSVPLTPQQQCSFLSDALNEIVYRLRYPQPLGSMTLFSIASLQHGASRRRQGFRSPVLVEEARALQIAIFQTIESNRERMDIGCIEETVMAIADEVNAHLLQALSGYENEKPVDFAVDAR